MDERLLTQALARFDGFRKNIPPAIRENVVTEYHSIVDALATATGDDLTPFKIRPDELKPKVVAVRPAPYGGGRGSTTYSSDKYCDGSRFQAQVDSLAAYLESAGDQHSHGAADSHKVLARPAAAAPKMDTEGAIRKIDKLIQDLSAIISLPRGQFTELFHEHLQTWRHRVYEELRDCGFTDAAERFENASRLGNASSVEENLRLVAQAKKANLTALLEDIKNNKTFYEEKLRKQSVVPETEPPRPLARQDERELLALISHSSRDQTLASALVDLLRSALGLLPKQVRCSSVDGYRLPAGVQTDVQLRAEVNASRVLIGLITPNSLASPYVLFELGARWGAGEIMIPLLAGVSAGDLRGPVSGLNALICSSEEQLHQVLGEIGANLGLEVQSPAAYLKQLRAVIEEAGKVSA